MAKAVLSKELEALYTASAKEPAIVDVPRMNYLMIDGKGDPNTSASFQTAMQTLFGVSYAAKFAVKKRAPSQDYRVMPPEGLWWTDDKSRFDALHKERWKWTLMIMQPDVVTPELIDEIAARMREAGKAGALDRMRLEAFEEGLSVQVLHVGPYAGEGATIARMHEFARANGYEPRGRHHEIYLGDPRRSAPEKLRTILRQPVAKRT